MGCRRERKRIQELLDGDLSRSGEGKLYVHLERCGSCRSYMEQMTALRKLAGIRKLEGRSEAYWRGYWARLKPKLAEGRGRRPHQVERLVRNPVFELAAVAVIVLVVMMRFNVSVFESPRVLPGAEKIIAPLRGPGDYRHVLGSASSSCPVSDERLDRVVYPVPRSPNEYVLTPARGPGEASWNGTITI